MLSSSVAHITQRSSSRDTPTFSSANEDGQQAKETEARDATKTLVQKLSSPTVSEKSPAQSSLWALAFERFERDDPKLAKSFSKCLGTDARDINAGLAQVVPKALEKIKEAQDSKDRLCKTSLGRYLKKAVEIIIASKDFIGSAVAAEPHAALAWCGVSLLLPVSIPDVVGNATYLRGNSFFSIHIKTMRRLKRG